MRVFRFGLLSSFAIVAFVATFSAEILGQDERMIGGGPGITVFADRNFRGDTVTYRNNVSSLPSKFNNKISSIRVGPGEQWEVCDQSNYRGQCVTVSGEERDLRQNNWDNRISSMRRVGGGSGPGFGNRPPGWLVGTWYWTAGNNRMTIGSNGNIDVYNEGRYARGSYRNGALVFADGSSATFVRMGVNLRTTNQATGISLDWSRTPYYGGGGNIGRPPSWAVGNWRAVQEGGLTMSIQSNGQVVVVNNGRYFRGTWYNNSITVDGQTSNMSSNGRNRMRGRNTSTGAVFDWVRN